jgi:hypothetical protein
LGVKNDTIIFTAASQTKKQQGVWHLGPGLFTVADPVTASGSSSAAYISGSFDTLEKRQRQADIIFLYWDFHPYFQPVRIKT